MEQLSIILIQNYQNDQYLQLMTINGYFGSNNGHFGCSASESAVVRSSAEKIRSAAKIHGP